jgi:hypothetical protein
MSRPPAGMTGSKKIIYSVAAVVSVLIIVFGVIYLTHKGGSTTPSARSTPTESAGTGQTSGTGLASYAVAAPAQVGAFTELTQLSTATQATYTGEKQSIFANLEKKGVGHATSVIAAYYKDGSSKRFQFVGYNGTFTPATALKVEKTLLIDTHMATAGPHGGEMMCGYVDGATKGSACIWATTTDIGVVELQSSDGTPVVQSGFFKTVLKLRADGLETPAA